MKIALIGYGKMGKEIEKIALERHHEIVSVIDKDNQQDINSAAFRSAQVAIEFSTPENAYNNIISCLNAGVAIVSGTTGWLDKLDEAKKICSEKQGAFIYASNYSLGVNIFFHINRELAKVMNRFAEYNISIDEIHHTQKLDAPSGTAITLAEDIIRSIERKSKWVNDANVKSDEILINSFREGSVPGTHTITYKSDVDEISLKHEVKNRKGLALGAIIAAEFIAGKKGFYTMQDVLGV